MKLATLFTIAAAMGPLLATTSNADQILIYKYSSSRPWAQYDCYRPDDVSTTASSVIPKAARVGTYTQTEYWVLNKTTQEFQSIHYYSFVTNGATVKEYTVSPVMPLTRDVQVFDQVAGTDYTDSVPSLQYFQAGLAAAHTANVCITFGDHFFDDTDHTGDSILDPFQSDEEGNLVGLGKAFTVAPGNIFDNVATTLSGNYIYTSRDEIGGVASIAFRSIYQESQTNATATLDAVSTKAANLGGPLIPYGGGTAATNGSLAYGVRVVELLLEGLSYDNADAP